VKKVEQIPLSEFFRLIKKPHYVLGTTYTLSLAFFESVVYPEIDRSNLKSCLILCDRLGYNSALTEGAALQSAGQDYMVVPAPVSGCFHPKVWIVIGDGEAVLLAGSGNLTQAGFMTNAEFFDALHFNSKTPLSRELLDTVRTFINGLASMWSPEDSHHLLCVETLSQIEAALAGLPVAAITDEISPRFLHSFSGPLIEQMPADPDARELYIAAPFFGNSLEGLHLFARRYPMAKLNVFPAVHDAKATDIPLKKVKEFYKGADISRLSVPLKKGAFAHLKLYGVARDKETAWICCTSANCTEAADQRTFSSQGVS